MTTVSEQCKMDLDAALGGEYLLEDGRKFWVDHATVREMLRRILPIVGAEAERNYLAGTHKSGATKRHCECGGDVLESKTVCVECGFQKEWAAG